MRRRAIGRGVPFATFLFALSGQAFALGATEAKGKADLAVRAVESEATKGIGGLPVRVQPITPAQRVAAGDMLLRNRDYERAIDTLSKVIELARQGKMPETALADGTFLLAESYFQSSQYLAARRHYREILDRASSARFSAYVGRALSRLVDVALRTDDLESLDYVFARLNSLPQGDPSGSLAYARAKALFARGDFVPAKAAINTVPAGSDFTLQAQYLLGVILTKEATPATAAAVPAAAAPTGAAPGPVVQPPPPKAPGLGAYAPAVEQFRRVTRIPATNAGQRHIVDLAWMAIGRLHYETDGFLDAAEAYSHVDRRSPEFSTMLHELAWVYVRLGEYQRAQRALEVLTITDPNNLDIADGSLLRADLMLRSGQFDKALTLYRSVRGRFDPIRDQVDRFINATTDPAAYYDRLTADPDLPTDNQLPPLALSWAREAAEDANVFAVIDDANRSRDLIKKTRRLATRLSAVLAVPTRAKAFPEIRASLERTLGMANRLARARGTLAEGLDDVADDVSGELASVRAERRKLMKRLGYMPVTPAEFASRDESGERQWNKVSQSLQQLTIEADKLRAIVNGLKRVLAEGRFGITADEGSRERFRLEIEANERDLAAYQRRIQQYREAIEMGRVQSGFGDQRYLDDEAARKRFRELLLREVELCAAGQDSGDAAEYARAIKPILSRADAVDLRLDGMKVDLERNALSGAEKLKLVITEEMSNVEGHAANLEELDQEARLVVGEVAMRNFAAVRDRLKSIVLRADIGIVQEAWEQREEQRQRVRNLQRERAREEQLLNDELREVLEDAEEDR